MPQEHTPAEIKTEASSEETKQFVHRVRRVTVTRRKFTPEEKVRAACPPRSTGSRPRQGAPSTQWFTS